jgi:hypothetical protein
VSSHEGLNAWLPFIVIPIIQWLKTDGVILAPWQFCFCDAVSRA